MPNSSELATEPWVSVEEAAAHLGVRKDSIYRWIERKGLPARKVGKLWKFKLSEVDAWVQASGSRKSVPMREGRGAAARRPQAPMPDRELKGLVLVVDDDESVRDAMRRFLAAEGYGSLTAGDGVEALSLLRSVSPRPDLIILDLGMPNLDGWAFREQQLRDDSLAGIPVIVVTAERSADLPGAAAVLRKPLDLDRLARTMERVRTQTTES